jgi:hypothetical protein
VLHGAEPSSLETQSSQNTTLPESELTNSKWNVEIPGRITDGTPSLPTPKPEPIDFEVLSSRTTRMDVTEAPEMPGLPPVTGTINLTVQLVEDPQLPDPPPPLPPLPATDPAVIARLAELREKHRGTTMLFLSATVYDHHRTLVRIYPNGRLDQVVKAWSNLDFNHFGGFSTFRVIDGVDGGFHDYGLLMGIGNIPTAALKRRMETAGREYQEPQIPVLPDLATAGPAFAVIEGEDESPAIDTLEQIHDLYRKEGTRMETAFHARVAANAARKAYLLANPPKPEDVTTWITQPRRIDPATADTNDKP